MCVHGDDHDDDGGGDQDFDNHDHDNRDLLSNFHL